MKNNSKFKQVALSALVLTAVAVPTVANAAKPSLQSVPAQTIEKIDVSGQSATFKMTNISPALQAVQAVDPVEVARKYAPDTVKLWKETLAAYKKTASQAALTVYATESIKNGSATTRPARLIQVESINAAALNNAKIAETISARPIELKAGGESVALKSGSSETVELRAVESVPASKATTASTVNGKAIETISAVSIASFDDTYELQQALETKNGDKIRAALSDLLDTYQDRIAAISKEAK